MSLQPGCRFAVAPHFHLAADWPNRLLVGARIEEKDDSFFPQPPWQAPTAEEVALLVLDPTAAATETPKEEVALFQLPGHLRSAWWGLLEQAEGLGEGNLPGFELFAGQVSEFLGFKHLPVPERAKMDVLVSDPSQWYVRRDAANRLEGLANSLAPWVPYPVVEEESWPRLWGGINLGDEATSVVLINLSGQQLAAELHRQAPHQLPPETVGDLTRQFLRWCADYPPVRLSLGPGEGYRLPRGGMILDGCLEGKQEPDVLLLISSEGRGKN